MNTIRSLSSKNTPPISTRTSNGGLSVGRSRFLKPNHPGMNSASAVRSCAMPIVATVSTRRGARQNRLISVRSTTKPSEDRADEPEDEGDRIGEAGHPVRCATRRVLGEQQDREDGRHRAEVALREVHDAVRAVDEREADGEQRGERSDQRALHDDAERRIPEHVRDVDQDERGNREREPRDAVARRCGRTRRARRTRRVR